LFIVVAAAAAAVALYFCLWCGVVLCVDWSHTHGILCGWGVIRAAPSIVYRILDPDRVQDTCMELSSDPIRVIDRSMWLAIVVVVVALSCVVLVCGCR